MSLPIVARSRGPRAAFGQIVLNEARLAWRQPAGMIVGIGISLGLLIIFGEVPVFQQSSARLGGLSAFEIYIPILIAFAIGVIALTYLPGPLVSYREQGILHRLSTTPVPASWVLGAQVVVQTCLMMISVLVLLIASIVFFGAGAPKNPGGLILAVVLSIAALFTIGLVIAAVARARPPRAASWPRRSTRSCSSPGCTFRYSSCRACCKTSATTPRSVRRWRRCRSRWCTAVHEEAVVALDGPAGGQDVGVAAARHSQLVGQQLMGQVQGLGTVAAQAVQLALLPAEQGPILATSEMVASSRSSQIAGFAGVDRPTKRTIVTATQLNCKQ